MERRRFIFLSVAGTAAASLPLPGCIDGDAKERPQFLNEIFDKAQVKDIGKVYLSDHPDEADRKKLISLIGGQSATPTVISAAVQQDFHTNRVVMINGWILSVTEARQSGLYYLNS